MELFCDRQVQLVLDPRMNIPLNRAGLTSANPRFIAGADHWSADIYDYKALLKNIHVIDLDCVRAFTGWFMGNKGQGLTTSTDMVIKAVDPDNMGNQGLINHHKIQLRRLSGTLQFIFNNHIKRTSYTSFQP